MVATQNAPQSDVVAIKRYFELGGGRKIEMSEMKALSPEERVELGGLCRAELAADGSKALDITA